MKRLRTERIRHTGYDEEFKTIAFEINHVFQCPNAVFQGQGRDVVGTWEHYLTYSLCLMALRPEILYNLVPILKHRDILDLDEILIKSGKVRLSIAIVTTVVTTFATVHCCHRPFGCSKHTFNFGFFRITAAVIFNNAVIFNIYNLLIHFLQFLCADFVLTNLCKLSRHTPAMPYGQTILNALTFCLILPIFRRQSPCKPCNGFSFVIINCLNVSDLH